MIGRWEMTLNLVLGNEADPTLPVRRRIVEHIVDLETVLVLLGEFVELMAQKDILSVHIRVNQGKFCAVKRIFQSCANDLKHWRNTRSPRDHSDFSRQGQVIFELALGSLDTYFVPNLQLGDVFRYVPLFVCL